MLDGDVILGIGTVTSEICTGHCIDIVITCQKVEEGSAHISISFEELNTGKYVSRLDIVELKPGRRVRRGYGDSLPVLLLRKADFPKSLRKHGDDDKYHVLGYEG